MLHVQVSKLEATSAEQVTGWRTYRLTRGVGPRRDGKVNQRRRWWRPTSRKLFPDRRTAWSTVVLNRNFELFVSSVIDKYINLLHQSCDGREKYSNLLVNWMEFERTALHEAGSPANNEWSQIEKHVGFSLSDSTRSVIVTSLMRAVFNRCQQAVVSVKEGETLLLEDEQCDWMLMKLLCIA